MSAIWNILSYDDREDEYQPTNLFISATTREEMVTKFSKTKVFRDHMCSRCEGLCYPFEHNTFAQGRFLNVCILCGTERLEGSEASCVHDKNISEEDFIKLAENALETTFKARLIEII